MACGRQYRDRRTMMATVARMSRSVSEAIGVPTEEISCDSYLPSCLWVAQAAPRPPTPRGPRLLRRQPRVQRRLRAPAQPRVQRRLRAPRRPRVRRPRRAPRQPPRTGPWHSVLTARMTRTAAPACAGTSTTTIPSASERCVPWGASPIWIVRTRFRRRVHPLRARRPVGLTTAVLRWGVAWARSRAPMSACRRPPEGRNVPGPRVHAANWKCSPTSSPVCRWCSMPSSTSFIRPAI